MDILITKAQRKILAYTASGAFILLVFWAFVYVPGLKHMQKYKHQLSEVDRQLNQVKMIGEVKDAISKGYTFTESIENLKKQSEVLSAYVPTEQEVPLEYISSAARRFNLDILSIKPSEKKPLLDKNNNPVTVVGVACYKMPVQVNLKGDYAAIASYIEAFSKEAPVLISVDNLKLGKFQQENTLSADIFLSIYLKERN